MIVSVWRSAHLALALVSCLFLVIASVTGCILAFDAVNEKIPSYKADDFSAITLAETLPALKNKYSEIIEIQVDHNDFVLLQGMTDEGDDVEAFVNPRSGEIIGKPTPKSDFVQWINDLHRSLFLHELGRAFMGVVSFLLFLIALSGIILIAKRQNGLKQFFGTVKRDSFAQFYHVIFSRFSLLPILILSVTGAYLSMERFHWFGNSTEKEPVIKISKTQNLEEPLPLSDIAIFKTIKLEDVQKIEFPFAPDPEEYYRLKLKDREIIVDQFSGEKVGELLYPKTTVLAAWSLALHTGRIHVVWAIVLLFASASILFFIYSGFAITLRRIGTRIRNKFSAKEANYILLAGSENGSTLHFANQIHQQLLKLGYKSYLTQPNAFEAYPNAEHLIFFTSTHGLGEAPSNATLFSDLIKKVEQQQKINISIVGFGSKAYVDFCGYAKKAESDLLNQTWAEQFLPLSTINDKSLDEFTTWVKNWSSKTGIDLNITPATYQQKAKKQLKLKVVDKKSDDDSTFILTLKVPFWKRFTSGDLLTIYPGTEGVERLYSIGKVDEKLQLVVKRHLNGLGSGFLDKLQINQTFKTSILENASFHLPKNKAVIMIANGTGIAPFLGMFAASDRNQPCSLYAGFRKATSLTDSYLAMAEKVKQKDPNKRFQLAFSRENNKMYVMDLIRNDADFFAKHLTDGGVVMLCGSLAMQRDVETVIIQILETNQMDNLQHYKNHNQWLTDCY